MALADLLSQERVPLTDHLHSLTVAEPSLSSLKLLTADSVSCPVISTKHGGRWNDEDPKSTHTEALGRGVGTELAMLAGWLVLS